MSNLKIRDELDVLEISVDRVNDPAFPVRENRSLPLLIDNTVPEPEVPIPLN